MKKKKMAAGICVLMLTAGLITGDAVPAIASAAEEAAAETDLRILSGGQENTDGLIYVNHVRYSGYYMDGTGVLYIVSDGVPEKKTGTVNVGTTYYDSKTGRTLTFSRQTLYVNGNIYSGYYMDGTGILYIVSNGRAETKTGTVNAGTTYYDGKTGKLLTLSKRTIFVAGKVYSGYYMDSGRKMYRVTNGTGEVKSGVLKTGTRYYSCEAGKMQTLSKQTLYVKGEAYTGYYLGTGNKMYRVTKGKLIPKSGVVNGGTRYYSYEAGKMRTLSKRILYVKGRAYTGYYLGTGNKMYRVTKGKLTLKSGVVKTRTRYYSYKAGKMRTLSKQMLYVNGKAYTGYYLGTGNKMYRVTKGRLTPKSGVVKAGTRYYSYKAGKMRTLSKQTLYVNGKVYTGYYLGIGNKMYRVINGTCTLANTSLDAGTPYYSYRAGKVLTLPSLMVYVNGKAMEGMSLESLITLQRAQAVVNNITNDSMTQEEKLSVCFEFVKTYRESNPRIPHYRGLDWPIVYANDMFVNGTGNCFSYAAAFAYMAKAIGYEEVYCCNDGHGWAEIDGLIYDPEWSMHHHVYSYYALSYDAQTDQNYKWILSVGKDWMRIKI